VGLGVGVHVEGVLNTAFGYGSHAEGVAGQTHGYASHVEGSGSVALGLVSHAGGICTIASGTAQTVIGKWNKRGNVTSLFVVGDGTSDVDADRSDIFRVNNGSVGGAGSVQVTGSLYVSGTSTFDPLGRDVAMIGSDVYFFVSGSSGSLGTSYRGVTAFGGDVAITGSLKVGTGSILITEDFIQFGAPGVKIARAGNDLKFYDGSNTSGATLTQLLAGGGGGGGGSGAAYSQSFVYGDLVGGVLTVTHNLDAQYVNPVVYDNSDQQVMPDNVTATSTTALDIDLTSFGSFAGTWNVMLLASSSVDLYNVVSGTSAGAPLVGTVWTVDPTDQVVVFTNNVVTASLPTTAKVGAHIIFKDGTGTAGGAAGPQMVSSSVGIIDGTATYTLPAVNYSSITAVKVNDAPETWIVV